jgi:mannose-6-phosphate isomerase-like protein (cupin superfamily)
MKTGHAVVAAPVDIGNAPHYRWSGVCDGWHLLRDPALSVIEERVPPGASETRHRHARAQQFFYVLDGDAALEVDGVPHRLGAGQGLHVPAGAPHRLFNDATRDVRFLVVSTPPSHGDRIDASDAHGTAA